MKKFKTTLFATALSVITLVSAPAAMAGPITCLAAAGGGGVVAVISLFVPGAIFATGPVILDVAAIACNPLIPTP